MRRFTLFVVLALVTVLAVLAGCLALPTGDTDSSITLEPKPLDSDRPLGEVDDYTANDTFDLDSSEGLTTAELEAVKYRSMARIEVVRGLQFQEDVGLEIVSRDQYREENPWARDAAGPYTNELWRAGFVVDGETEFSDELGELYGGSVQGYYSSGRIVLVTDEVDSVTVDRDTLVHELVHALQDQHFGLARSATTIDEQRAESGLVEGEANYVPSLYDQRCGTWECLPHLEREPGVGSQQSFNVGLYLSIYAPYAEGPTFVQHLHERGGHGSANESVGEGANANASETSEWAAVDAAFENRPTSTEQIVHPERYPDVQPVDVPIEDRSGSEWEPFTKGGENGGELRTETVGEATLFATLFANGVLDRSITAGGTELSPYNYSHPVTDGWAGDTLVVYHDGDEDRTGHVWRLAWKSEGDATQFEDAYRDLLERHDAEQVSEDTYRVPDESGFAGAYRVTNEGEHVTVVGGPTVDALEEIHDGETGPAPSAITPIEHSTSGPTVPATG
ncbi:Hvo_1808 family surface protein [Halobacteria archaeon AArc-m2/3/4]|uniref:Hvo_1808 family surface protein n=1 Tax=Natronoglomus mannanivorans TaxID=2979990 RepID=A0ABT2QFC6_9EURY|nr:Hvo_1808 family surface protein [Halobacteria archaeon AArc-m2/3/4]